LLLRGVWRDVFSLLGLLGGEGLRWMRSGLS
jgi:hypothetical protein